MNKRILGLYKYAMLSPQVKRNLFRIIPFGVIWFVFSIVYSLLEKGLLGNLNYYPATKGPYNFSRSLLITAGFSLLTGLFIGTIETLYLNKFFIQKSFSKKILYKTVLYLATITLFLIVQTVVTSSLEMRTTIFHKQVWGHTWTFLSNYAFLTVGVYIAVIIVISQFYAEMSENIGQVALFNFFTGRYHRPKEEERIFMFLDMRSSTHIAEQLGHVRYFEMLKAYYSDLSDPVVQYSGEIYQYVGDEMVVSWNLKNGLSNNNCIQCFFAMKAA
ncbi:MAG TPA: adenylate/guanylate cyclase domain-containing protein, partial [Chitinophaga sp.]|uniref:adenylate/guanylate cyclase domain-containing protein n=1 Tax=Chitinophaga sp. TaxID=1869181 RepID=UPI002F94095B